MACEDEDECLDGSAVCDEDATCSNNNGSYECTGNDDDSTGDDFKCSDECKKGIRNCDSIAKCADGYKFKEKDDGTFECVDIDECDVDAPTNNCVGDHTKCTNTVGSFTCNFDTDKHVAGQGVTNGDEPECIDFESCTSDNNECYDKLYH